MHPPVGNAVHALKSRPQDARFVFKPRKTSSSATCPQRPPEPLVPVDSSPPANRRPGKSVRIASGVPGATATSSPRTRKRVAFVSPPVARSPCPTPVSSPTRRAATDALRNDETLSLSAPVATQLAAILSHDCHPNDRLQLLFLDQTDQAAWPDILLQKTLQHVHATRIRTVAVLNPKDTLLYIALTHYIPGADHVYFARFGDTLRLAAVEEPKRRWLLENPSVETLGPYFSSGDFSMLRKFTVSTYLRECELAALFAPLDWDIPLMLERLELLVVPQLSSMLSLLAYRRGEDEQTWIFTHLREIRIRSGVPRPLDNAPPLPGVEGAPHMCEVEGEELLAFFKRLTFKKDGRPTKPRLVLERVQIKDFAKLWKDFAEVVSVQTDHSPAENEEWPW